MKNLLRNWGALAEWGLEKVSGTFIASWASLLAKSASLVNFWQSARKLEGSQRVSGIRLYSGGTASACFFDPPYFRRQLRHASAVRHMIDQAAVDGSFWSSHCRNLARPASFVKKKGS